jgi:L-iditol 2-dehydrogenase
VRVTAVGVCGSDLHWFDQASIGDASLKRPLVLGHEFAGIEAVTGRRVAVDPAIPCGSCEFCLEGNPNLCPAVQFAGHGDTDGALREALCWPGRNLYELPEALSEADGAMLEPLGVAIHALDLSHLRAGMQVGVFGCGPIGLLILQLARLSGAERIIATDRMPHRAEAACALGAEAGLVVDESGQAEGLGAEIGRRGLDVVFEVAGENAAVEAAVKAAKPGGKVILVGIPSDDHTGFSAATARRKGLTIKLCRRMKNTYPRAIQLAASGRVDVRSLVTHRFPLEEAQQGFLAAERRQGLKVIIEP